MVSSHTMPKKQQTNCSLDVAVIASSGGGTATLGHTDPRALLRCIDQQLRLVGGRVRHALFVSLDGGKSLDSADERVDRATLYQVDHRGIDGDVSNSEADSVCEVVAVQRGTLQHVNEYCRKQQTELAESIRRGAVRGLICVSCHTDIFRDTLEAASRAEIPVTGSGGTSLSQAASRYHLVLVGNAGGSVATTTYTRAVSYTHALASHHRLEYRPWKHVSRADRPRWTSVLNACLPAFWGVCLSRWAVRHAARWHLEHGAGVPESVSALLRGLKHRVLPAACAMVMAGAASGPANANSAPISATGQASLWMAAAVASSACCGSAVAGLLAGYCVAHWSNRVLFWCIFRGVPATMTNLLAGGGVGGAVALFFLGLAPHLAWCSQQLREWLLSSVVWSTPGKRMVAGGLWGLASCYGCKVGCYHAFHLPLILMEMEHGEPSFLGAIDELTLVLVCAGVCLGNLAADAATGRRLPAADVALARRGLRINLCYGDFVECCYPFMEASRLVNVGGYLGSALSAAYLVREADTVDRIPRSLAYLPWPVSVALAAPHWGCFLGASLIAVAVPFLATWLSHARSVPANEATGPKQD